MELQPLNRSESKYFPLLDSKPSKKGHSWYSRLFFLWIWPLVFKGLNQELSDDDTIILPEVLRSKNQTYKHYLQKHGVIVSVFLSYKWRFTKIVVLKIINIASMYIRPVFVKILIWYVSQDHPSLQTGLLILVAFIFCTFSSELLERSIHFSHQELRLCVLNGIRDALCQKILRMRPSNDGNSITLLQTDVQHIQDCLSASTQAMKIPIQIVFSFLFVYHQVGISMLAGLGSICLIMFINYFLVKQMRYQDEKQMKITDERTRISKETISEVRMVKAFAQQSFFYDKIMALKMGELRCEKIKYWLRFAMMILVGNSANIAVVLIFVTRILILGQTLTAQQAFVTILAIGFFQGPFGFFSHYITIMIKANVSANRIKTMINQPDIVPNPESDRIKLENCSFSYEEDGENCLTDINLQIKPGSFIAIVGPVGSGKSSLLNSFMSELFLKQGNIKTPKSLSFAPSLDSWLMNTTLRENVTMGEKFNQAWFQKVVSACGLSADINMLKGKDLTEIGERGINLSGGQKARVCLARAVYAKKDVILMDDSLSSVDAVVAKEILNKCILGILKNKTRVLVTHRLEFTSKADLVIHMKDGKIEKISKPEQTDFSDSENSEQEAESGAFEALVPEEENQTGRVDKKLYLKLVEYLGSWWPLVLCFIMLVVQEVLDVVASLYLKQFGEQNSSYEALQWSYIFRAIATLIFNSNALVVFLCVQLTISKITHSKMVQSLLKAPVNLFFDVTPTGRILNRLGSDQGRVDGIAWLVSQFFNFLFMMISIFLIQFLFFPWLSVSIPFIFYASSKISKYFIHSSLQIERLKANTNSAILNAFTECLTGSKLIRCFDKQVLFQKRSQKTFDHRSRIEYTHAGLFCWMLLNLICIGKTFVSLVVAMIIFFSTEMSVGIVGLCLLYSFQLPHRILVLILITNELENQMVAFERIQKYIQTPSELETSKEVDSNWPLVPTVVFKNVTMSYRPNTPQILKNLSFFINPGLRVGLVGRTGSGKSSLFLSILRIVQLESGEISIGGQNIAEMKLSQLRKAITLIPQDPLVFQDSLRNNLDYQNVHTDQKILDTLQKVNLSKYGLDYEIKDKGKNLSVGERQLLSIARSLLFKSKVVLVDEATAGIDTENDELIQKLLRENFQECTMIVIAHRLNTIMDSDQIFVLDQGELLESGSPEHLLSIESSFKKLVEEHDKQIIN